jgi:hypothetical protein
VYQPEKPFDAARCFVMLGLAFALGHNIIASRGPIAKAQTTRDTSLLELLNDGPAGYIMANLIVYGSVAKGKLSFERKTTWDWRLVLMPSPVNNFHLLNRAGAPIFINASAIFDDGCWHKTSVSGWLGVHLPPYGTTGDDSRSAINDLKTSDTTWLVADNAPNNPVWIDARATGGTCSVP